MSAWHALVFSSSEKDYTQNLEYLDKDYESYAKVLKYIRDVWLTPYKERFVGKYYFIISFLIFTINMGK